MGRAGGIDLHGNKDIDMNSDGGYGNPDQHYPQRHGPQAYMGNSSDCGSDDSGGLSGGHEVGELKGAIE